MSAAGYPLLVEGRRHAAGCPDLAGTLARAFASRSRPRCLCRAPGIEMYVARWGPSHIVKRMPGTGSQHAADCISYEPPVELSGLGQVLGTAIVEDVATGTTTLKLAFSLSTRAGATPPPPNGGTDKVSASAATRLSLRGLLHYLWDQAELTRWQPGFAGRRSWATVRRHLLQAAENKAVCGAPLASRLYVPEPFSVEQRDAISARRIEHWHRATSPAGKSLLLMIAELKEIVPTRHGHRAAVKHLPDLPFALGDALHRRLVHRFGPALEFWGITPALHMLMIATLACGDDGIPRLCELMLAPASEDWLLVDDGYDHQLLLRLVRDRRSFIQCLRYNSSPEGFSARAMVTDTGESPLVLHVDKSGPGADSSVGDTTTATANAATNEWRWNVHREPMPPLPPICPAPG